MKVKQSIEDFRVEELSRLEAGVVGAYSLYRLEKRGIGTPEALRVVERAWRVKPGAFGFAGLKDRHAHTGQNVTLRQGPRRNFRADRFRLNYLGACGRPAGRGTLDGNRFSIVVRDLSAEEARRLAERAADAARHGYPDYYDDQRFGSLRGTSGRFVAEALLAGGFEAALRLALASPSREDRSRARKRRVALREGWGAWARLVSELEPSPERRICEALGAGESFEQAYERIDPSLRSLHLSAYQSHLFNSALRMAVPRGGPRHPGVDGPYRFYEGDPGELAAERIPLASGDAPPHPLLDVVLAGYGVDRDTLATLPFRPGARAAVVAPGELTVGEAREDELNRGRCRVTLSFRLRPGSYATMLLKRCTHDFAGRGRSRDRGTRA